MIRTFGIDFGHHNITGSHYLFVRLRSVGGRTRTLRLNLDRSLLFRCHRVSEPGLGTWAAFSLFGYTDQVTIAP